MSYMYIRSKTAVYIYTGFMCIHMEPGILFHVGYLSVCLSVRHAFETFWILTGIAMYTRHVGSCRYGDAYNEPL